MSRHALKLLAMLAVVTTSCLAADPPSKSGPDWHQVEVLVFAQDDPFGDELSAQNPQLSYPQPLRQLAPSAGLFAPLAPGASYNQQLVHLMVAEKFLTRVKAKEVAVYAPRGEALRQLNSAAQKLARSSDFRVLFHQAWIQPVESQKKALWVQLSGGQLFDNHYELEGAVRIYRSRFFHVQSNLWLNHFESALSPSALGEAGEVATQEVKILLPEPPPPKKDPYLELLENIERMVMTIDDPLPTPVSETNSTLTQQPNYRLAAVDVLNTEEQFRRKKIHYLDHPRMGVLVLVTPMASNEEDAELELGN